MKKFAYIFIVVYLLAQVIMPRLGFALVLNFDTSCYSGSFKYIERINTGGSSCGASGSNFVGFPFVINFDYNTSPQKVLVALIDFLPVAATVAFLVIKKKTDTKSNQS